MEKILKALASIEHDKLLHSYYGTIIYIICLFIFPQIALVLVFAIAIGKEIYDEVKYGGFSFMDIIFTVGIPIVFELLIIRGV